MSWQMNYLEKQFILTLKHKTLKKDICFVWNTILKNFLKRSLFL